jgi:opacity protein-like surface antigen
LNLAAGIDYMFAPSWIFGVEYNHYGLGTKHCVCTSALGVAVAFDQHVEANSVLARLSYKFGM